MTKRHPFASLRRAELPFVGAMFVAFFLIIASFWILKPLKKSIFIQFYDRGGFAWMGMQLDAAQAELLAKVLNMVVALAAAMLFGLLATRLRRDRLVLLFTGCFLLGDLLFAFVLSQPGTATVWSFYLYGDLYTTLMVSTFFAFLNDSVSPAAAKRIYGPVGLGGVAGGVVGSSMLGAWIDALSVAHWMWICAAVSLAIGAAAVMAARASQRLPDDARSQPRSALADEAANPSGASAAWAGARLILRSRYLLAIAAIVGTYEIVSTLVDFQFTSSVAHWLDGDAIGSHFARVFAITNVVSVLVQLFATSPIMTRFGVTAALLVLPVAIASGSTIFLAAPSLWTGSLLSTADNGFAYSIQQSAKEALYVPTSAAEKYQAKAFIDMFVQRFAKAVAVGVSLGITTWFASFTAVRWLSLLALALMLVWLPAARYAGRRFDAQGKHSRESRSENLIRARDPRRREPQLPKNR